LPAFRYIYLVLPVAHTFSIIAARHRITQVLPLIQAKKAFSVSATHNLTTLIQHSEGKIHKTENEGQK